MRSLIDIRSYGCRGGSIQVDVLFVLTSLVAVGSLLLGGGTHAGFFSDVILQLLAVPLLALALWRWRDAPSDGRTAWPLAFCAAIVAAPLMQVVPLPPSVWQALPHRETMIETFRLIGRPLPYEPISVAPYMTWAAIASLVPPLSLFLATLLLEPRARRNLALLLLLVGVLSVFVGFIQVFQGPESWLRFYEITNPTDAVGFFANRNHLAALLYCLLPFAAAWISDSVATTGQSRSSGQFDSRLFVPILVGVATIAILLLGQVIVKSRAGLVLAFVSLPCAFVLIGRDRRKMAASLSTHKILAGAISVAIILSSETALYRIFERFGADPLADSRWTLAKKTFEAAKAYFPFGAGFGTFPLVYETFLRVEEIQPNLFANRAHNDGLEILLEGGIFGAALIVLFLVWWAMRTRRLWSNAKQSIFQIDEPYARAASIIVLLLVLHSLVDYPLRTGAMAAIFALSCGLMVRAPPSTQTPSFSHDPPRSEPVSKRRERAGASSRAGASKERERTAPPKSATPKSAPPDVSWPPPKPPKPEEGAGLDDFEWPDEWRKK